MGRELGADREQFSFGSAWPRRGQGKTLADTVAAQKSTCKIDGKKKKNVRKRERERQTKIIKTNFFLFRCKTTSHLIALITTTIHITHNT